MENKNEQMERLQQETSNPKRELLSSIGLFIGTVSGLGLEPL